MTFKTVYPFPCRDCGTAIQSESERYGTHRRCRPCGLANGRAKQQRIQARRRGEDIPLLKPGPPTLTYPFPCARCGVMVNSEDERGENWKCCKPCRARVQREKRVRQEYGLSAEEFAQLEMTHAGRCGICNQPPGDYGLVVDHCHARGTVRGLLCLRCNWLLGHADDSPARLRAAADYLERWQ